MSYDATCTVGASASANKATLIELTIFVHHLYLYSLLFYLTHSPETNGNNNLISTILILHTLSGYL